MLSIMGLVNLPLFFAALRLFVLRITGSAAAAAYALLFTLVLWGPGPLMFSGFFHLQMLGDDAQYPSMFAATLTLFAWAIYISALRGGSLWVFLPLGVSMATVTLTHPHTAMTLNLGLVALWCAWGRRWGARTALLLLMCGLQVAAALAWPYYPFLQLVLGGAGDHHLGNRYVYSLLLQRYWPLLFCLPFLLMRLRERRLDPLVLMFLASLAVYIGAYITRKYGFGRNITFLVLFVHISAAEWMARAEQRFVERQAPRGPWEGRSFASMQAVTLILAIYFFGVGVYRYRPGRASTYISYLPLRGTVTREDVVLTDPVSGPCPVLWRQGRHSGDLSELCSRNWRENSRCRTVLFRPSGSPSQERPDREDQCGLRVHKPHKPVAQPTSTPGNREPWRVGVPKPLYRVDRRERQGSAPASPQNSGKARLDLSPGAAGGNFHFMREHLKAEIMVPKRSGNLVDLPV